MGFLFLKGKEPAQCVTEMLITEVMDIIAIGWKDNRKRKGGLKMKEIKLRAWDKVHQKMYTCDGVSSKDGICVENAFWGHFLSLSTGEVFLIMTRGQNQQDYREIVDFELMQYTGKNDKNRMEIYTDDIIRIGSMGGKVGRVIFDRSCLAYMVVNEHQWTDAYRLGDFDGSDITIIGNIHDNPELLEVAK